MNTRFFNLLLSLVIGFVFWQLMTLLADWSAGTSFQRLFSILGGSSGIGFLKLAVYAAFICAVLDLRDKTKAMAEMQFRVQDTHAQNAQDAIRLIELKFEDFKTQAEGQLEIVRYTIQALPMVGFCASLTELSHSLTLIDNGTASAVRNAMYIAFDTTLISLALTLVLMFLYHTHIERLDMRYATGRTAAIEQAILQYQLKRKDGWSAI